MRIFRIENKDGKGPWSPLNRPRYMSGMGDEPAFPLPASEVGHKLADALWHMNEMPLPREDGGMRWVSDYFPGVSARIGCKSLEQLDEWFPAIVRKYFAGDFPEYGFTVAEYEVPEGAYVELRHQVVFDPRKAHKVDSHPLSAMNNIIKEKIHA